MYAVNKHIMLLMWLIGVWAGATARPRAGPRAMAAPGLR